MINWHDPTSALRELLVLFPVFLISISLHEAAHAFMADRLGDPTARLNGRMTLNPLAHLDPLGTLMLLIAPFGWAKPVPVDPRNLKGRFANLLVSAAGPLSNFFLAVLGIAILKHLPPFSQYAGLPLDLLVLRNMDLLGEAPLLVPVLVLVLINTVLMFFNLLPFPPLDGWGILSDLLPRKWRHGYFDVLPYGIIALVLFMTVPGFNRFFNVAIVSAVQGMIQLVP